MKVEFLSSFNRDVKKIKNRDVRERIWKAIEKVESVKLLSEIQGIEKVTGESYAYRMRIGEFRIGIYFKGGTVSFARAANRKDIYRIFPS